MLFASARSVREERSRQRCALQDFSIIRVSLIKGKGGWRIGSVESISNPFFVADSRDARAVVTTVVRQLRRYVQGEGAISPVYDDAIGLFTALRTMPAERTAVEGVFTLRLLSALGYISDHPRYHSLLEPDNIIEALSHYSPEHAREIERVTTIGTAASHL